MNKCKITVVVFILTTINWVSLATVMNIIPGTANPIQVLLMLYFLFVSAIVAIIVTLIDVFLVFRKNGYILRIALCANIFLNVIYLPEFKKLFDALMGV